MKRPVRGAKRKSLKDLARYITTNRGRMRYASRRAQGLLVGSGPIEGAIGYVVQARLKRTGRRWSVPGARNVLKQLLVRGAFLVAVLALRLRWANDEWDRLGARPAAA